MTLPWGDKPDQAGLTRGTEFERVGPLSFCLDGADVYILDSVNERILRAEPDAPFTVFAEKSVGSGIGCDSDGNVLVWDADALRKYSPDGSPLATRRMPAGDSKSAPVIGYGVELQRRGDGSLGLRRHDQSVETLEPGKATRAVVDNSATEPLHYFIKRMSGDQVRLLGQEPGGKILVTVPIVVDSGDIGAVIFKGTDNAGNLYVELESVVDGYANLEAHRYAPTGERLAVFSLPNDYYTTIYKKTEVAPDGSIYQMLTRPTGVSILRYTDEGGER